MPKPRLRRPGIFAAAAILATSGIAGGVALAAVNGSTAACTAAPQVVDNGTTQQITVTCDVPKPAAVTETVTVPGPTVTATVTATPTPTQAPTSSAQTSAPPTSPSTTTAAAAGDLALPRVPWEGGSAYYKKFPKAGAAGWDDPSFFPISVFLSDASDAAALKAVGVNTYMAMNHTTGGIAQAAAQGMYVLPQVFSDDGSIDWKPSEIGNATNVPGWFITDECDQGLTNCGGDAAGENGWLAKQQQNVAKVKAYNDGRFMHSNFGSGITRTWWSPNTMGQQVALMDTMSADKYSYTSPYAQEAITGSAQWPAGANVKTAASYGWQVDQLRSFMAPDALKPTYVFVETMRPFLTESGATTITPNQLEGAVWSGLIHEARGVTYFQHNNDPGCSATYSLVNDCGKGVKAKVTQIDADIKSLAPVLNTQSYIYNFGATGIETMLKTYQGSVYVFADVALKGTTGSKTFTLPAGVTGTSVTVVGENRTLPVTGGKFTDSFAAEYTHHIYKITL